MNNILEKLFSSRVRASLLKLFLTRSEGKFYVREAARLSGEDYRNVVNELSKLENLGILISERQGNLKYFRVNNNFPILFELKNIVIKTEGVVDLLKEALYPVKGIRTSFIYGSMARGEYIGSSDIDLFVIGSLPLEKLLKAVREPESILNREITVSLFTQKEVKERLSRRDEFLIEVWVKQKLMIIGEENELPRAP